MVDVTHPELVRALVKPPQDIISTLSQRTTDLWHGATGVAGETGELLEGLILVVTMNATVPEGRVNVVEELGDLFFYIEQICQRVPITLDWDAITAFARNQHLGPDSMLMYGAQCSVYGSQVLDTIKKAAIYNKELDTPLLTTQLTECAKYAVTIGYLFGVERVEALHENIVKLSKRYESLKYTDGAAHARADKQPQRKFFGAAEETPIKVPLEHPPGNPEK
jgi:hypothetical protein